MGRSMRPPLTGIGRYTRNLALHLSPLLNPPLTMFATRDVRGLRSLRCERVTAPVPTPHEALRAAWEQTVVPYEVWRRGIDVYHSPNYTLPLRLSCPGVVTIHDLAFLDSRFHNRRLQMYLRLLTKASLRRAAQVIAVSEYTKVQLESNFPYVAGKVSVVHSGLDPAFTPMRPANGNGDGIGAPPYVLFVGSIEPRKNLPRLIRAFEMAMTSTGLPHELVLCGPWGWRYGAVEEALRDSPMRSRIRRVGYVPSSGLRDLYTRADALAYPSLDEGFGFPVLEAMSTGTPVITTNRSAPPEVAGGAAVTVTPEDTQAIATAIATVLTDRTLARDLAERGRLRAAEFTWERAADQTLAVYRRAAGGN